MISIRDVGIIRYIDIYGIFGFRVQGYLDYQDYNLCEFLVYILSYNNCYNNDNRDIIYIYIYIYIGLLEGDLVYIYTC